ncbi:MAG: hypothetical protein KGV44_07750 [Flavobacteriaceae bacterium]|nr:hypothetical protein [Flavobacteriaceae bacterium]
MDLPKYQLSAENNLEIFEFTSVGKKGEIKKLIKFSETHLKDFYNLGFGDKNPQTEEIDDKIVSNNGDREKVLATVVSAVYAFTDKNPNAWVYATGSSGARTRLYRIGINKYYDKIIQDFEIYGLRDNEWQVFQKNVNFEAFVVRRLKE